MYKPKIFINKAVELDTGIPLFSFRCVSYKKAVGNATSFHRCNLCIHHADCVVRIIYKNVFEFCIGCGDRLDPKYVYLIDMLKNDLKYKLDNTNMCCYCSWKTILK